MDGLISFNNKPLRLAIYLGLFVTITDISIFYTPLSRSGCMYCHPWILSIISSVGLLGGIQLISIDVIGEYIGWIYYESKKRPRYIFEEKRIQTKRIREKPAKEELMYK
ncbi:hypothetical protein MK805_00845 [Shimazuella sp. AN120528]|uniref:hypothetical protein n=1 Tax=Shimazuella soli TaxID=1892854 RepID=UPI001F110906|nr:hypothetical protein [Shimazuella soli]MCH5583518.1 hypothetical protein [Shimazuella soli]